VRRVAEILMVLAVAGLLAIGCGGDDEEGGRSG
jgi:hypothetical protein